MDDCETFAAPVKLRADAPEYFALLANFRELGHATLCVYDAKLQLVYIEVLPSEAGALQVLPMPHSHRAGASHRSKRPRLKVRGGRQLPRGGANRAARPTQKRILQVAGVGCLLMVVFLAVIGYWLFRAFVAPEFQRRSIDKPADVGPVGVSVGKGFLRQSVFFEDARLGTISDVTFDRVDHESKVAAAVVGRQGADFLSADARVLRSQRFPRAGALNYPFLAEVAGDGTYEWVGDVETAKGLTLRVLTPAGKNLWEYANPDLHAMAFGCDYLNHDRKLSFVVGGVNGLDLVDWAARESGIAAAATCGPSPSPTSTAMENGRSCTATSAVNWSFETPRGASSPQNASPAPASSLTTSATSPSPPG